MIWQEILFEKMITKYTLANSLADSLKCTVSQIEFLNDLTLNVKAETKLLCQSYQCETQFPLRITIYILDTSLVPHNDLITVSRICQKLNCRVLMSDKSLNPNSMLLLTPDGQTDVVSIDLDAVDETSTEIELI
ncbi:MAG: hypothetical protein J7639_14950 [Paenibacillaceae bacterium]|nr:hypothetical protein [Paenibacillaceae bacterium]